MATRANMDTVHENKLSIKNLLFSKAIPNYVVRAPTGGHKLFSCTDCGDKFVLESSYEDHVDRKSVQISYVCRYCDESKVFYNRCNLLSHIRSHAFKTATINVSDLKVEPLPISFFNMTLLPTHSESTTQNPQTENIRNVRKKSNSVCFECKKDINDTGVIYKDRAKHYMEYTNKVHSCPICMFSLPTSCGLAAHLRIHLKCPPYYCPECGIHLPNKIVPIHSFNDSFNHDCEGYKMIKATARLKCPITKCPLFHPNQYREHMKQNHLKKVFKCPFCFVACFSESIMVKHLKSHKMEGKASIFFQCEMCPGRLVLQNQIDNHIKCHVNNTKYPCWVCGTILKDAPSVLGHHMDKHDLSSRIINDTILKNLLEPFKPKRVYRVVKRCGQCKRSFTYKCKFEQIGMLPNECPYKLCSNGVDEAERNLSEATNEAQVTCNICKDKMSENWQDVKKHFALHHKSYRCLDAKIVATKLDISKITKNRGKSLKQSMKKRILRKNKRRRVTNTITTGDIQLSTVSVALNGSQFACSKCKIQCNTKQQLETHMLTHRDPCMAYQCMECGQCFVVKPSFSTHLLLEHNISDVQDYIIKKPCYNENAFLKHQYGSVSNEPLRENQCTICREQFNGSDDLEKHFRVHGMAFLMKNNSNKNISP